jgi:hypothetical protein
MDAIAVQMVSFAGIYTNSIHRKIFPARNEKQLVLVGRYSSLAFAAIILPLPYAFGDMPQAMRFMWVTVPPMAIAFFLAVLWPRANRHGALASFLAAFGSILYAQYVQKWTGDEGLPKTVSLYLIAGTVAGVVVSLLTREEDTGRTRRFFLLLRTPVGQEQRLRDAGLVEVPGTGTYEEPAIVEPAGEQDLAAPVRTTATAIAESAARTDLAAPPIVLPKPSKQTVYGFLAVGAIALMLIAIVELLAWWLRNG